MRSNGMRSLYGMMIAMTLLLAGHRTGAETSTMTLDLFSFVSFEDQITMSIPAGGTVKFEFGAPNPDGSIPFQISPSGVDLPLITSHPLNATLKYALAGPAVGLMTPTPSGRQIAFSGTFSAQDMTKPDAGVRSYPMLFTTENASAESADGSMVVSREGYRVPDGADYVQIVGATVAESENENGSAVYLVLSGTFDHLP